MAADGPPVVDALPTLSNLVGQWIERHCVVADRDLAGQPYKLTEEMWAFLDAHYGVHLDADPAKPASAWLYRRSQLVRPQKWGKAPFSAAIVCAEAVGPTLFAGFATGGEVYRCSAHGCPCGWSYTYLPDEPMGRPWATPLIQITAASEDQTDNVWRQLVPMIELGPLADVITDTGETRINLPGGGRIDPVTSKARSRLGQPITCSVQDEALALDTPLPTPRGWITMGEVQPGDQLIGSQGRPVRVLTATSVQADRNCFRVTFSDGTSVVASDGHQWLTRVSSSTALPRVRTTREMFEDGRLFRVPAAAAYELTPSDLPFPPYALGLWLGDGARGKAEITAHDDEAVELAGFLSADGVSVYIRRSSTRAATLCLSRKAGFQGASRPATARALQSMECYHSKHIPENYLRASKRQRTLLLQGLMDSDGHITPTGFCTFAGNDRLTADVQRLLRTLGVQPRRVRHVDPRARTGEGWKVNFLPRHGLKPFRLARKAQYVRDAAREKDWIAVALEPCASVPVRCIAVDASDHLFLAGEGGHVTHNTGVWTKSNGGQSLADTQRRGLAGMGGRAIETTNAWDPAENSVAQRGFESSATDVYRDWRRAPATLSYGDRRERRRIHKIVYGDSWWVDLDRIEAEALEIMEKDPGQAERFFGNRAVAGQGTWLPDGFWEKSKADQTVPAGVPVALGFDGSESNDWTAIRLVELSTRHRFTPLYGPDRRKTAWDPAEWGGSIPRGEVRAAVDEICATYKVVRAYCDPRDWQSEIGDWALVHGQDVFVEWATYRIAPMHDALTRSVNDLRSGRATHDDCKLTELHVGNARKIAKPGQRYILGKPSEHQKIDMAMADTLAQEAAEDAIADGWKPPAPPTVPRRIR